MGRSGRGWGPFTGGQLTVMVCVLVAAVALPVGAAAVTFTNVAITDPGGVNRAKVTGAGNLSVTGSVTANNASALNLYQNSTGELDSYSAVATPPAGKALVITSLNIDAYGTPGGYFTFYASATDATCNVLGPLVGFVDAPTIGVTSIPIPSGLVIPANRALCAVKNGVTNALVMVFGYLVAASAAPPGAAPTHDPVPQRPGS